MNIKFNLPEPFLKESVFHSLINKEYHQCISSQTLIPMKNTLKMARWGLLFGLVAVFFASCDEDETPEVLDIVETASADSRFTSLVAALTAADLVSTLQGAGPFTVFAPTDAAFADFLSANGFAALEDVPTDVLTALLLNHVVSGKVLSTDLAAGYVSSLATEVST
ncbi:MAG: hypothetical protein ACI959_002047, partial [Limisphaerales bacterium]